MDLGLYNRVRETSTTTGTGTLTLAGAAAGFHTFTSKVASGARVRYVIHLGSEFEYGLGTFTSPDQLARTTVLGGSNGASLVNFSAGTKDVFCDALAEDIYSAAFNHIPGRISGRRFLGSVAAFISTGTVTLNTLISQPFYVGPSTAFDGIVIACLGDASSFARLGLRADGNGRPGALIVDAGQVDCSTAGEKVAAITQTRSGMVWLDYVAQGVTPRVTRADDTFNPLIGVASAYVSAGGLAYSQTGITGALPSSWGSTYTELGATAGAVPLVYLRTA